MMLSASTLVTGTGLLGYRILSVFMGMITLAVMYAFAKRLFGSAAGIATTAFLGVNMFPVILSRSIIPETLLPITVTGLMLAIVQSFPIYREKVNQHVQAASFAAMGVLIGLSFYLHPSGYIIALYGMIFIGYMIVARRPFSRRELSFTWFALVILIILVTPYLMSTLQEPNFSGANRLFNLRGESLGEAIVDGFSGLFLIGDQNPTINLPNRPLIDLGSGLLVALGFVTTLVRWREPRFTLILLGLLLCIPTVLFESDSPNFIAWSLILPFLAVLFAVGIVVIFNGLAKNRRWIGWIALILLVGFNLQWTMRDLFSNWGQTEAMQTAYDSRLGNIATYIDHTSADTELVICTPSLRPALNAVTITDAQKLALMIHRQTDTLRYVDCGSGFIFTYGGGPQQVIMLQPDGLSHVFPYVRNWIARGTLLNVPSLPPNTVIQLDVQDQLADQVGRFQTTAPIVLAEDVGGEVTVAAPPISFGNVLTYLGDERDWSSNRNPGDVIPVITYWRIDDTVPDDLRIFTHLLSDPRVIAIQTDTISVIPAFLQPRDIFIQVAFLQLPYTMPQGEYTLSIGTYRDTSSERLDVNYEGNLRGNRIFLGPLRVNER